MSYARGQVISPEEWWALFRHRDIWAEAWEPAWYILRVPPMREAGAVAWLGANGAPDAWYPTEERWYRQPRCRRQKRRALVPVAPGYLFALLDRRPQWDVLVGKSRGKVLRVICRSGEPYPVPERAMMEMRQVPGRIEEVRAARAREREIHPGDRVEVDLGGASWQVDISRINAGIAHFVLPLMGGQEVSAPVATLRKVGKNE